MEQARKKKIRSAKVVATNIFMGLSVAVIVLVLTMLAMGYSFNKEGGLEQSGLVQVNSRPGGAIVEIDGVAQQGRTEMSKMLSAGEHTIKISRPGYDVWERLLDVDSGLLTRVDWVRLFPVEQHIENVQTYGSLRLSEVSPDKHYMLMLPEGTAKVQLVDIRNDDVVYSSLDLGTVMGLADGEAPAGSLSVVDWNKSNDKFLLKWVVEESVRWLLIDIRKVENSVDVSAKFLLNFDDVVIASDAADKIWALADGDLRLISIPNAVVSGVLVDGVESIASGGMVVAYVRNDTEEGRSIGVFKDGEQGGAVVQKIGAQTGVVRVGLGSYWGDDWIAFSMDDRVFVRSGSYPSYGRLADSLKTIAEHDIGFTPEFVTASPNGRFAVAAERRQVVAVDAELREYWEYEVDTEWARFSWLDNFLTWEIWENKLVVRDFDGNNRREISTAASGKAAAVTENNRWLYFVVPEVDGAFGLRRLRL